MTTRIEWTDETWNPVRGCRIVSEGCRNCYAMKFAHRYSGPGMPYEGLTKKAANGPVWTGEVRLVPDAMDKPLHWKKPRRIFVNSMSDLFHEDVLFEFIDLVFEVIEKCPQHTFQILTKRAERMAEWAGRKTLPRNAWMGVSVENQATANERIPHLLRVTASVRFLSMEPLLGPVEIGPIFDTRNICPECDREIDALSASFRTEEHSFADECDHCGHIDSSMAFETELPRISWVIVGGESGPGARPMHPDWVREIRNDCAVAEVPFFFKQWGAWVQEIVGGEGTHQVFPNGSFASNDRLSRLTPDEEEKAYGPGDPEGIERVGKKAAGRKLDGRTHDEYPEAK